jgi:UDP-GlcNAc:undecaprenyl-phosphate GlcNAc-1-phosphate transferase
MQWLPFVFAFALTGTLTFLAVQFFPRLGLLDQPAKYGLKRAPIPYFGGLAIFVGFLISVLLFVPLGKEVIALLAGATLLVLISFLDDLRGLSPLLRLATQIFAALLLIAGGVGITEITNPLGGLLDLTTIDWLISWDGGEHHIFLLADLFAVGWIVLLINTVNWLDGVPGLSAGISGIAAFVLFFLAARPHFHYFDQSAVLALSAILAGGALAFTFFNFAPPRILLGDTGSMLLGFLVAALAIFSGAKIATAVLVLGFPLVDAAWVIASRLARGVPPWRGGEWDRERRAVHLHHRFLAAGFSERQTATFILAASVAFGGAALLLTNAFEKMLALLLLGVTVLATGWWLTRKS